MSRQTWSHRATDHGMDVHWRTHVVYLLALLGLVASFLSSCGAQTPAQTAAPKLPMPGGATNGATSGALGLGVGVNVEPSYRPWRYMDGPAPESWWCAPPNCAPDALPQTRIDTDLSLAAALGVNFVRVEFPWRFLEPQRGVFDWSRADLIVQEANRYHVRLQPIIVFTPAWAAGDPTAAPAPDDFRTFVSALVGRYHRDIQYWELWNEPDLPHYWTADERAYVDDILIPGYQAAKAADPSSRVIIGGPSWGAVEWFDTIYTLGGGNSFDIIAWHEYTPVATVLQSVRDVKGVLSAHGQANKPMWLGELGAAVANVTDTTQASLLRGVLTANSGLAQVDWYTLRDEDAMSCCPPTVDVPGHYGLVERDGQTYKAAFTVLQQLIRAGQ